MKVARMHYILLVLCLIASNPVMGQLTIDATGPVHSRLLNPSSGTSGSIGRKLSIQLSVGCKSCPSVQEGSMDIIFTMKNTGNEDMALPISPHSADLETKGDPSRYTLTTLRLFITSDRDHHTDRLGGVELYGNKVHPETLYTLVPNASVRVIARINVAPSASEVSERKMWVAHAQLSEEIISIARGRASENSQEIGSTDSTPYSPQAFISRTN